MANRNQQPAQVVIVKHEHGCLVTALVFVLFGWIGLAVMAAWKLSGVAWRWFVVYPVKWTWQASAALWRWSAQGSRWLTARYGWRGWAVVSAVVVVLAIFGGILQATGH